MCIGYYYGFNESAKCFVQRFLNYRVYQSFYCVV
jgi:hypothetical protein